MIQLPKTKLVRFFTATGVVALIVLTAKYCHLVPSGANAPSRSGHQLNFFCFLFHQGKIFLFRYSQQLSRIRFGPLKGFLS